MLFDRFGPLTQETKETKKRYDIVIGENGFAVLSGVYSNPVPALFSTGLNYADGTIFYYFKYKNENKIEVFTSFACNNVSLQYIEEGSSPYLEETITTITSAYRYIRGHQIFFRHSRKPQSVFTICVPKSLIKFSTENQE